MKKEALDEIVRVETLRAFRSILGEDSGERGKQERLSNLLLTADDPEEVKEKIKPTSASSKKKDPVKPEDEAAELADVTLNKVVEKLNMMRSGKSANDEEVQKNLDEYFKSLSMGERQSLFVFLDALNQIMTAGVEGKAAPEPHEKGIGLTATTPAAHKKAKEEKSASIIVVGEAQNTDEIRAKLKSLLS